MYIIDIICFLTFISLSIKTAGTPPIHFKYKYLVALNSIFMVGAQITFNIYLFQLDPLIFKHVFIT